MGALVRGVILKWLGLEDVLLQFDALKLRVSLAEDEIEELQERAGGWLPHGPLKGDA